MQGVHCILHALHARFTIRPLSHGQMMQCSQKYNVQASVYVFLVAFFAIFRHFFISP